MIKINLLKSYTKASDSEFVATDEGTSSRADALKKILILLIGPIGLYLYQNFYNIPQLQQQRDELNSQYNQLVEFNQQKEVIAREIAKYEEDKIRLNRQTQFLEKISKERLYPNELVSKIKDYIPDGVWLVSLQTRGQEIEIRGNSDKEKPISEFESRLSSVSVLRNVRLQDVNVVENSNSEILKKKSDLKIRDFYIKSEYALGTIPDGTTGEVQ